MKYRQYHIMLEGPQESKALAIIKQDIPLVHEQLAPARRIKEAIELLFPDIKAKIASVTLAQPTAEIL